jgi:transcriptional regulator with XRE-family HTH domain
VFLATLCIIRERAGLTQVEFSQRLGRSQNFVSSIERAVTRADSIQLYDWYLACGTSLSAWVKELERGLKDRHFPIQGKAPK